MNRSRRLASIVRSVPRRRGDEPVREDIAGQVVDVFPAGAGMNR